MYRFFDPEYANLIAIYKFLIEFIFKRELILGKNFRKSVVVLREFVITEINNNKELMNMIELYNRKDICDMHIKVGYLPLDIITREMDQQQNSTPHHISLIKQNEDF